MGSARDVVVIGASAGGVEALRGLVGALPGDLPAAVCVVLHIPREGHSALAAILTRSGRMPAREAVDGERLAAGRIYVAPADRHLLVVDHRVRLSRGPPENGHRPAVDPLFRSAARAIGPGVIGVVLSGSRDDGTAGLASVVARGGLAFAQDPEEALQPSMPRSALEHVPAAVPLPVADIARRINQLVRERAEKSAPVDALLIAETDMADMAPIGADEFSIGPAGLGCPACHGALFELPGEPAPRYRCRVGHAWSPDTLIDEQGTALDEALWTALRALEEKAALSWRMSDRSGLRGNSISMRRYASMAVEADEAAKIIRDLLTRHVPRTEPPEPGSIEASDVGGSGGDA
jgi:two-component system, chemotaxis family, protein-glutamate methylesterase/glutaminase